MKPADVEKLEGIGFATWPALEERVVHGWLARAAEGVTRRSNSINPGAVLPDDLDQAVDDGIAWLAARHLPAIFRLTPLAHRSLDDNLAARGFERHQGAFVMTRSAVDATPAGVEISSTRTEEWTDVLAEQSDRGGAARDTVSALLDSHDAPTAYVLARSDGEAVAVGMAVVTGDHVAVFSMRTREPHRRKGHSRRILDALMAYGVQHGAATAFLQVHPANATAVALYEQAGFRTQYEYWYRQGAQ